MKTWTQTAFLALAALTLGACAPDARTGVDSRPAAAAEAAAGSAPAAAQQGGPAPQPVAADPLHMVVHKSATCGCCELWVEHMQAAGFHVDVRNSENLGPIKEAVGVPVGKGSCHTAQVGRYYIEGHVPAEDVKRLLAEQPDAKGLVLPGMPAGSPGMEMPDGRVQAYTVELVHHDMTTTPFAQHAGGN